MLDAKETIQNALIGLVIALTAYLLLYVVNPDLVGGTLGAPSTAIDAVVLVSNTATGNAGTLPDGTECNDVSGPNPGSGTSPSKPFCSGNCSNGYYTDSTTGKVFCGQDPAAVAAAAAAPNAIGCCIYNLTGILGNDCEASVTKAACDSLGVNNFVLGTGFSCVDMVSLGSDYVCEN
jgi:hypothetical protein